MVGIYLLKCNSEVVYVGKSTNIENRIKTHKSSDKIWDDYETLSCKESELDSIEIDMIKKHSPKYNIKHNDSYQSEIDDSTRRESIVIPVDQNTKDAVLQMCKDVDLKQNQLMRRLMIDNGYLNKDGTLKAKS